MDALLKVDALNYSYHSLNGETLALKDLSFEVRPQEFLGIIGPSGCGKSTILSPFSVFCPRTKERSP